MSGPELFLLIVTALMFGYAVGKRILLEWAQPYRMLMPEIAMEILSSDRYSPEQKDHTRMIVEKAWSPWWWIWMLLVIMFVLIGSIVTAILPSRSLRRSSAHGPAGPREPSRRFKEVDRLKSDPVYRKMIECDFISGLAANPICAGTFMIIVFCISFAQWISGREEGALREVFNKRMAELR